MVQISPIAGTAAVNLGEGNNLTVSREYAVVSDHPSSHSVRWEVRPVNGDTPAFTLILVQDGPPMEFTLSTVPDDSGAHNVVMKPLESPPSKEQMWTMEEGMAALRDPPIVAARLQSVAVPDLSAAMGGQVALQVIYLPISGMPNKPDQNMRWNFDYQHPKEGIHCLISFF